MDILHRLTLCAAKQPRTEAAELLLDAANHIESLRLEVRTQRHEIAALREERNVLLEWERPSVDDIAQMEQALLQVAAPKRPDGTYNHCREACEQLAKDALRRVSFRADSAVNK